jgi:hypothetical protein
MKPKLLKIVIYSVIVVAVFIIALNIYSTHFK